MHLLNPSIAAALPPVVMERLTYAIWSRRAKGRFPQSQRQDAVDYLH